MAYRFCFMKFRSSLFAFTALCLGFTACTNDTTPEQEPEMEMVPVRFSAKPYVELSTRVVGNAFQNGDQIGIFCVDTAATKTDSLLYNGNYADNVRYTFSGDSFSAAADPIMQYRHNILAYTYYIVYPYTTVAAPEFMFTIIRDQRSHSNYNASDLALQKVTTRDLDINLQLKRMMANVNIYVTGQFMTTHDVSATISQVLLTSRIDLNAQKATADPQYARRTVTFEKYRNDNDTVALHAIIAPQRLTSAQVITLTVDEDNYNIPLPNGWSAVNIPSGYYLPLTCDIHVDNTGEIHILYGGEEVQPNPMESPYRK